MKNISLISKIRWNASKATLVLLFLVAFNYSGNAQNCNFSNSDFDISTIGNHAYLSNINSNWHSYEIIFDSTGRWQYYNNDISFNSPGLKEICMHVVDTSDLNVPCDTFICKTVNIQIDTCPDIIDYFSFSTYQNADTFIANLYFNIDGYTSYQFDYGDGTSGTSNYHNYPDNSPRTVCLMVNNSNFSGCEKTSCITIVFDTINQSACNLQPLEFQKYIDTIIRLNIYDYYSNPSASRIFEDNINIASNSWANNGFKFFVYDTIQETWQTYQIGSTCRGPYNDINCGRAPASVIEFPTTTLEERKHLIRFLYSIPCESYVFGMSLPYPKYGEWLSDSTQVNDTSLFKAFEDLGISKIRQQTDSLPFVFFSQKCNLEFNTEQISRANPRDSITASFSFHSKYTQRTCRNSEIIRYYSSAVGTVYKIIPLSSSLYSEYYICRDGQIIYCNDADTTSYCHRYLNNLTYMGNYWSCDSNTTTCDSVTCVLPGDADHDLTVNNFDVLAIGLSYGRLGLRRPDATNSYTLQPSPDWQTTHYYGYNDKFADCNGDSIINAQDAVVIYNNYIERAVNVFNHRDAQLDSLPQVTLTFDTLPIIIANGTCAGAQIAGDININSVTTIDSSYGIAFSVEYPESFYDSCFSVAVDLDNNSWFVSNEPVILFYKNIPQFHRVDVSMVRTNGLNRSGNGRIGRIKFITEGDIFGRQLRNSSSYVYTFNVNSTQAIDNRGNKINITGSSTTVSFISLGYKQNEIHNLQVFPNPVNNILQLRADERITEIEITDITGKMVYASHPDTYQNQIDCSVLPSGIYIMQVKSDEGLSVIKLVRQ
ncbi:MAG TPA: T9SS type A sorting domain-containing protein [Chitinophagales bacterium]|nr:T9SS type A sorting domain-containing protein [Chitinophagales bacterium]